MSTLSETLLGGDVVASGARSGYRAIVAGPGEPRQLRLDLAAKGSHEGARRLRAPHSSRSVFHLAHVTDLQLADLQSPGRFEFFESLRGLPATASFVPAQRPQEGLLVHAFDSMVRSIELAREGHETGAPVELVISTGDNLDNAQWNELEWYLALLGGGEVDLGRGRPYRGVQAAEWPNELFWHPEGGPDRWKTRHGFPTLPGLVERAIRPFVAGGLSVPWVSCYGNHDGLPFGEVVPTAEYRALVLSSRKPRSLPAGFDPLAREPELFEHPELFLTGPSESVPADATRRIVSRRDFIAAHMRARGLPSGHGYATVNLESATTYFVYDPSPLVRVIVLDTANLDGWHEGSLGARQFDWLEQRLSECHSVAYASDGRRARTGGEDRLVVIASHHGLASLSNLRQLDGGIEEDQPRRPGTDVRALLARFPNIVVWLNGHRHRNEIVAHASLGGGGYFEISTASVADWPSQGRLVEIVANKDGTLSVLTTMLNHLGPPSSSLHAATCESDQLASLHRELAGNVPRSGFASVLEGSALDRNCELVIPAPF
ncbi:MAG: TIGR03767 family metallophosphoesterase [Acidimicrobiales bacterium]